MVIFNSYVKLPEGMTCWLVVWNMNFIFHNSWDDDPIWLSYFSGGLKPPTRLWLVLLLINNAWWRNIDESWWIRIRKIGYWWHDRRNMNKAKMHVRVQVEPQSLFRRGATEVFKSPWEESTSAFRRSTPNDTIPNQWVCLKIWYLIHFNGSNMFKPSFSYYLMGIIWG